MLLTKQLGMIPSWQYDTDWVENPKYNRHVVYPEGWNQLTTQPVGANYAPPEGLPPPDGLGRAGNGCTCCWTCSCENNCCCDGSTSAGRAQARYMYNQVARSPFMSTQAKRSAAAAASSLRGPLDIFDSPAWVHRKWIIVGGVTLLGLAAIGGLTALLR